MSLSTVFWALANYFSVTALSASILFWVKIVLFFAAPHAVLFALFVYNFPAEKLRIRKSIFIPIIIIMLLAMVAAISPLVFSGLKVEDGTAIPQPGKLMPFFAMVILGSLVSGTGLMINKMANASKEERAQWRFMLTGVVLSYALLVITNFVFVILFKNTSYNAFGPVFMIPAVAGMGYAILRHHLLNVKTIATEILTFVLLSISLFEVMTSKTTSELLFKISVFALLFVFGSFLIKSVLKEVEQREKLEILTKELEAANEKLKDLDKLKSEFLSFASHQVKAPMAIVKGYAELIRDGSYGQVPEKVTETAGRIEESADRMIKLVEELLNLRKIEEGRVEYNFEIKDISGIVKNVTEELKTIADKKGIELNFESVESNLNARVDEGKFRQIVQNIIENSIKYTEKGWVRVELGKQNESAIITVSDSGIGMSRETIGQLFEQFHRGGGKTKLIRGTGLGLYIAQKMLLAHGGEIKAESEGDTKGSKFTIRIPIS